MTRMTKIRTDMKNCVSIIIALFVVSGLAGQQDVKIWEEKVSMPTYLVDPPGKNPRFYNGRAYQGAQGRVYPYPMVCLLVSVQ